MNSRTYSSFLLLAACICLQLFSCQQKSSETSSTTSSLDTMSTQKPLSYLALGDSYTIGESVPEQERWPIVLAEKLKAKGTAVEEVKIIAKTGWTTDELNEAIDTAALNKNYDLVSLLIGVNNQYRGEKKGFTLDQYTQEFEMLLNRAIGFAGDDASQVFVVSIPDYGITPFAQELDAETVRAELIAYDSIAKQICLEKQVRFLDITPISREAEQDSSLVAPDGLHPSGRMYQRWVEEVIFPEVQKLLAD